MTTTSRYPKFPPQDSPVPTKLRLLLAEYHWKRQGDLADLLEISRSTFSHYVNGLIPISSEHLVRICNFFQVPITSVVGYEEGIEEFDLTFDD